MRTRRAILAAIGIAATTGLVLAAPASADVGFEAIDDLASTGVNTAVHIAVLDNDVVNTPYEVDVDSLDIVDFPDHGFADAPHLGGVEYEPDADFVGTDTFTYEVCATITFEDVAFEQDPYGGGDEVICDEADVTVEVEGPTPTTDDDTDNTTATTEPYAGGDDDVDSLGTGSTTTVAPANELPRTGGSNGWLALMGFAALVGGLALVGFMRPRWAGRH